MELNKYQTPIEDLHLEQYPKEVQEEFLENFYSVPFIQRLVSKNRPLCKDLPRDEKGRAIIDLTNPPIIEDIDYFRPTAIHFEKTGTFTSLRPNRNPNSEYMKWVKEEVRRAWEGYIRPSDGAWVTGDMYWYLNYVMIQKTVTYEDSDMADRVDGFPEFWEGILWRTLGWYQARQKALNFAEISKRGSSKSYSTASKLSKDFIIGENKTSSKNVRGMIVAYTREYLTKDGTLNKFENMIDFIAENTNFPSKRLKSSLGEMFWQMGYIDLDTGAKKGTKNQVMGVAIKDDPDKPRGKRSITIIGEEFGAFPKITDVYNVMLRSVREGSKAFGQMILIGTGGSEGSDFSGALEMIYRPKGYYLMAFDNVWDKSQQGKGVSIWCFPAYVNRKGCYNKDGISDVTKALLEICVERYNAKYNTSDPMQLTRTKAEDPITLQDAIMRRSSTIFPVSDLKERILQLDSNPSEYDDVYTGKMVIKNGNPEFKVTTDVPIRFFPHKDNKLEGAIEIFKLPQKNKQGKVFAGRYIAGNDPYDDDASQTTSLGSTFILDLWTDTIVAEYTGRPLFANDYYEQVRLLLLYYNARLNYENNKKGLFAYFQRMNCSYLLTDTLEFLKDRDSSGKDSYGNKQKGTNASKPINDAARSLIRDWLISPVTIQKKEGDEVKEVTIKRLYTLRCKALLEELSQWNPDGNFDRVSAMGMLMLLREDKMILYSGNPQQAERKHDASHKGNDNFFSSNYDVKFKKVDNKQLDNKL
jgi:hypothetical protein